MKIRTTFLSSILLVAATLVAMPAHAIDQEAIGYTLTGGQYSVEVLTGEYGTDNERENAVAGLTEEIANDVKANPDLGLELGWFDAEVDGRNPAETSHSRAQAFIGLIQKRLNAKNIQVDAVSGNKLPLEVTKKDQWYSLTPRKAWTFIRISTSTGFRVGSLLLSGLSTLHSFEVGAAVFVACSATAAFAIPIMEFSEKNRIHKPTSKPVLKPLQKLLNPNRFSIFRTAMKDERKAALFDQVHFYVNWGAVEFIFGVVLVQTENFLRSVFQLPAEFVSSGTLLGNALFVVASQGVWEKALTKDKSLQDFMHEMEGGDSKNGEYLRIRNEKVYKYSALGSVMAVVGMASANSSNVALKIAGYGTLATLGTMGLIYNKRVDAKKLKYLNKINSCNVILGGNLPALDEAG